jgi:cytokinesis protein
MAFYGEDPTDENARRDFFAKLAIFITEWKKSREKNIVLEITRKRNEESMKRKRAQNQLKPTGSSDGSTPPSPISTGAMDSLLEKLRAAAPQVRDQRDRRRRARLQGKHQVRVASGQRIPDPNEIPEVEETLKSHEPASTESLTSSEFVRERQREADEDDIAERAALLLQGMRGLATDGTEERLSEKRDSMRKARDEERKARRRRREQNTSTAEAAEGEGGVVNADESTSTLKEKTNEENEKAPPPTTMISPPSPEGSEKKPIELDD